MDGQQVLRHVTGAAAGLAALLDGVGGVAGGGDLHRRGAGLHLALLPLLLVGRLGDVPFAGGDEAVLLVEALDDLVLQQRQRVGAGQARQQAQAVGAVLDQALLVAGHALELAAAGGVAQGDGQRGPGRRAGRGADGNAAADQRAQHGEEAAVARLDRRGIIAPLVDVAEAVEQVFAGDADVVEQDRAVVDARQAALVPVVADGHPRHRVAVLVADGDQDAVHAVGFGRIVVGVGGAARGVQLREHRRHAAVAGGVADVRLLRRGAGGVDDELVGLRVVRRGGLQVLHVGPVAALGHGEAAEQVQVDDLRHQVHVAVAAERLDGAAEQPPLHARLHHHSEVGVADHFHAGQGRADFAGAAVGGAEHALGHARVAEPFQAGEDGVAGLVEGQADLGAEEFVVERGAHALAIFRVLAVEELLQVLRHGGIRGGRQLRRALAHGLGLVLLVAAGARAGVRALGLGAVGGGRGGDLVDVFGPLGVLHGDVVAVLRGSDGVVSGVHDPTLPATVMQMTLIQEHHHRAGVTGSRGTENCAEGGVAVRAEVQARAPRPHYRRSATAPSTSAASAASSTGPHVPNQRSSASRSAGVTHSP